MGPRPMASQASEVRAASALLRRHGLDRYVSAKVLAAAAKEAARSVGDTLKLLASLQMAGAGEGPAPVAAAIAEKGSKA